MQLTIFGLLNLYAFYVWLVLFYGLIVLYNLSII